MILIATGGTAEAAAKLVEISGGKVACFIFVINLFDLNGCANLIKKNYKVENLIEFPGTLNLSNSSLYFEFFQHFLF